MSDITSLRDTRVAKKMGVPLTTPFEWGVTSPTTAKHWVALDKAGGKLEKVVDKFIADPQAFMARIDKWKRLQKLVQEFREVFWAANAHVCKLGGVDPDAIDVDVKMTARQIAADPSSMVIVTLL